jgi:hypothetical protein
MTGDNAAPAFSVLLPTRNRLDLARGMAATLFAQDFADWELIVADNASDDDVRGWCESLGDPRVRCLRSDVPLPVTENWNRALDAARGAHVVMMGDDDGLAPGYFARITAILAEFPEAQLVYHGAWHFAFPGAHPSFPDGALTDVTLMQAPLAGRSAPAWLPVDEARALARAAFDMRCHFAFNMQHLLLSRGLIDAMRRFGPVFQGPFPDFYAANLAMMIATRIVVVSEPLVLIGISKKSYGYHHFGGNEGSGASFLGIDPALGDAADPLVAELLPGSLMNTAWVVSVARAARYLGERANLTRYRRLQIISTLDAPDPRAALAALRPRLRFGERLFALALSALVALAPRLPGTIGPRVLGRARTELSGQYLPPPPPGAVRQKLGGLADMQAAFAYLARPSGA